MQWTSMAFRQVRLGVVAGACLATGWSEWKTWRASREFFPSGATDPHQVVNGETILVLGCPTPVLHRWRVRVAIRSTDPRRAKFIFSGAAVRTPISEAQMMADYAVHKLGVPAANVVIEDQSRSTVENVANSTPLLAGSPAVKIASNTFHARRARLTLCAESPDIAAHLVRARDYKPFEWGLMHPVLLIFELYRLRITANR
jgi:uncharacterized SAM-binding protein YcdF (DUF218 family)